MNTFKKYSYSYSNMFAIRVFVFEYIVKYSSHVWLVLIELYVSSRWRNPLSTN